MGEGVDATGVGDNAPLLGKPVFVEVSDGTTSRSLMDDVEPGEEPDGFGMDITASVVMIQMIGASAEFGETAKSEVSHRGSPRRQNDTTLTKVIGTS